MPSAPRCCILLLVKRRLVFSRSSIAVDSIANEVRVNFSVRMCLWGKFSVCVCECWQFKCTCVSVCGNGASLLLLVGQRTFSWPTLNSTPEWYIWKNNHAIVMNRAVRDQPLAWHVKQETDIREQTHQHWSLFEMMCPEGPTLQCASKHLSFKRKSACVHVFVGLGEKY